MQSYEKIPGDANSRSSFIQFRRVSESFGYTFGYKTHHPADAEALVAAAEAINATIRENAFYIS